MGAVNVHFRNRNGRNGYEVAGFWNQILNALPSRFNSRRFSSVFFCDDGRVVCAGLFFGFLFGNLLLCLVRFLNRANILAPQLPVKFMNFFDKLR